MLRFSGGTERIERTGGEDDILYHVVTLTYDCVAVVYSVPWSGRAGRCGSDCGGDFCGSLGYWVIIDGILVYQVC